MKHIQRKLISIQVDGNTYDGECEIEGTNKLFLTVHYDGRKRSDGRAYKPSEESLINHFAKVLLAELVSESTKLNR